MVYLFHKNLMTPSTNTLIKNTAKLNTIIGAIQKEDQRQNLGVFLSE